jgi:hypothetical protein
MHQRIPQALSVLMCVQQHEGIGDMALYQRSGPLLVFNAQRYTPKYADSAQIRSASHLRASFASPDPENLGADLSPVKISTSLHCL